MVNYIQSKTVISMKVAKKYLTEWHIETLKKAIMRNPGSLHNTDREQQIKDLEAKLEDLNYEE